MHSSTYSALCIIMLSSDIHLALTRSRVQRLHTCKKQSKTQSRAQQNIPLHTFINAQSLFVIVPWVQPTLLSCPARECSRLTICEARRQSEHWHAAERKRLVVALVPALCLEFGECQEGILWLCVGIFMYVCNCWLSGRAVCLCVFV